MPNYTVHIYPIVRITYDGVEAATMEEAITEAEARFNENKSYDLCYAAEYADDTDGFVVDELDEETNVIRSVNFDKEGNPTALPGTFVNEGEV